ncbi:NERD domain-containing protein [Bacillus salacetis]|uniref:NERD domain-containing protein n=1 Tax=Bacillus salacetis TaxID=2315464 RepID=A0A3A1QUR0_9BACI|nr:nuclease-related domain-containing protein [Bacillus salacetis]RIW30179.1 NERD domain-containing protein [Bacillus salacetis]
MFDEWALPLEPKMVFLNDLLLDHQGSTFQIDSCALGSNTIFNFEVKNFEGDYRIKDDKWLDPSGEEIKNPLLQIQRADSLIRQKTRQSGFKHRVESFLIFINPGFYLYNPPPDTSIIYFPQLSRFLEKILNRSMIVRKEDQRLAEKLLSMDIEEDPYRRLPPYQFENLRKGIICLHCRSFFQSVTGRWLICSYCKKKETTAAAILRTTEEFRLLFPGEKVTTGMIYEFCGVVEDKRTVRKVLLTNFEMIGIRNHAYYVEKLKL